MSNKSDTAWQHLAEIPLILADAEMEQPKIVYKEFIFAAANLRQNISDNQQYQVAYAQ